MKFNKPTQIVKELKEKISNTNILLILGYIPHLNYTILEEFLSTSNIPYIVTWKNRTVTNAKYYCGLIGSLGNHSANYICKKATDILVVGDISIKLVNNSYQDAFSVYYLNNKNVYSLVLDKSMAYEKSKKIYITNDFNYIFKNLKINVPNSFLECVSCANSQLLYVIPPKSELEKYCYALSLIYNNNKLDIPFVTGVGNHWYAMGKYFRTTSSNNWFSSTEWASIGCGYFYGIGAYFAQNKPVWILEGDGGTAFSGTSLLYLINNKHLPITTIIINDKHYSAIYSYLYNFNKQKYISKTDKVITTTPILNTKIFQNCKEFNNVEDFYKYLNKYPTSNQVIFIIIHINKSKTIHTNNSFVYGINIHDKEYINLIKNNDFLKIKNYTLDHKLDIL